MGPWPSFVTDTKRCGSGKKLCRPIGPVELSYKDKEGHWKHGGIWAFWATAVAHRPLLDVPTCSPRGALPNPARNQPRPILQERALREGPGHLDRSGSGMLNMHGLPRPPCAGAPSPRSWSHLRRADPKGWDWAARAPPADPACCLGKARCEDVCIDTETSATT